MKTEALNRIAPDRKPDSPNDAGRAAIPYSEHQRPAGRVRAT